MKKDLPKDNIEAEKGNKQAEDSNTTSSHPERGGFLGLRYVTPMQKTITIVAMIILLVSVIFLCVYSYLDRFQYRSSGAELTQEQIDEYEQSLQEIDEDRIEGLDQIVIETPLVSATPAPTPVPKKELRYILLIGLDSRGSTNIENASADVMKVLVIDEENNELKLVSLMRDILIEIPGQIEIDGTVKQGKLNSVYFFNGPDGLCETITEHFQIPVDEYVIINWNGVEDLVNAMGGVEVDVKYSELKWINQEIRFQSKFGYIEYSNELYKNGLQVLDGNQALAYCRIRKTGNGDYDRVNRQVTVLKALFDSVRDASLDEILSLLNVVQQVVKTNISPTDLIKYAEIGYGMLDAEIMSMQVPVGEDGVTHQAGRYNGQYVLKLDFAANVAAIHDFLGNTEETQVE